MFSKMFSHDSILSMGLYHGQFSPKIAKILEIELYQVVVSIYNGSKHAILKNTPWHGFLMIPS